LRIVEGRAVVGFAKSDIFIQPDCLPLAVKEKAALFGSWKFWQHQVEGGSRANFNFKIEVTFGNSI
jgi:hypothetical protein